MGMSWKQEIHDWNVLLQNTTDPYVLAAHLVKWAVTCTHSVYLVSR